MLEKAASDVLIEESIRSIEQGRLGDEDHADKGFDIGDCD